MANKKQEILQEVIRTLEVELTKAHEETKKALTVTPLTVDSLCESSKAVGRSKGIADAIFIIRDLWISAINEEDK